MSTVTLDASFWSRALATLIGTLAGFIFSIVLFYVSEHVKRSRDRTKIVTGLKREAAFNVSLCDLWLHSFADIRLKMAAGDKQAVFNYIDYTRTLRIFVQEALRAGILYDLLSDTELVDLDKILRFLNNMSEQDINAKIHQWKTGEIEAPEMSQALSLHEYVIKEGRKAMAGLHVKAGGV
ncbi:MAG: hypothetical protein ACJ76Y_14320 [Thermoanaerobaculia bacterium]